MFEYNTKVERVVDGDTIDVFFDLGFEVWSHQRIRLAGIDAPEKNTPYGKAVKAYLIGLIEGKAVRIQTTKPDKYGRYLGKIFLPNSTISINDQMVIDGLAKAYQGDSKSGLWTADELLKGFVEANIT
jgi:micrococcal nuclease